MNFKTNSARISFKNCEYEGEISQNRPHGRGFAFFQSGNAYYGEWKKGNFDGNGIYLHFTGVLIKSHFFQGKIDGIAEIFYCRERKSLSLWKNGSFYQEIPLNNSSQKPLLPKGLLVEGLVNGSDPLFKPKYPTFGFFEHFFLEKKLKFFGNWKNSKSNGLGFALTQSSVDIGEFKNGCLQGFCRKVLANGNVIIGEFQQGLLQGSCMMFDKEKSSWVLSSFRNGERIEVLSEGISEFPPIFKYSIEKTATFQDFITEDFIEKSFLDKILANYKKIDCSTPIKVPLIEIEGKSLQEPSNFSTVYSQIIDKNNPYNSPKSKTHLSVQKPKQSPKNPILPKKLPSFSKGTRESPSKYPISPETRNFSASKPKLMKNQTSINFFTHTQKKSPSVSPVNNKNTNNFNSPSVKKPITSPYHDNKTRKFVKQNMKSSTAANFFGKTLLTNSEINAKVCEFGKKQGGKADSPNRMGFSVYCAKNSNPVFMLEDSAPFEEKKAPESPINRLVMKLKIEPRSLEEKPLDFCREIEGVNNIIEAALDEDQMMSSKMKKSKSSGIH